MILEQFDSTGKAALITGATKGLGKIMALALAEAGADVAITSRHLDEGTQVADEIAAATSRRILPVQADVGKPDQVEAMVDKTLSELGRIDVLINNAGVNVRKPIDELTLEEWSLVVDTNLTGPFLCCRAVARHMKERKSGRIINIGSMLGEIAMPERTAYCSTKGGLHMMTKVLALELAPYNINVNAVAPGPFMTEMNLVVKENPEAYRFFIDRIPQHRWADPKEIGGLIVYLAGEASKFMTGSVITIDGGWTAQ